MTVGREEAGAPAPGATEIRGELAALVEGCATSLLRRAFGRVPGRPLELVSFYLLGRRGPPSTGRPGGAITVRAGVSADVAEMSRLEGKAQERLTARLTAGDHCVVAVAGTTGAIVGYEWFTEGPRVVEDVTGYVIDVPPGGLYAYDGFIAAAFRGRGVFSRIQAGLAALMQDRGRERVITMVHADNETSLAANLRLGFRPYRAVRGLTLLGRRFFVEESLATA